MKIEARYDIFSKLRNGKCGGDFGLTEIELRREEDRVYHQSDKQRHD